MEKLEFLTGTAYAAGVQFLAVLITAGVHFIFFEREHRFDTFEIICLAITAVVGVLLVVTGAILDTKLQKMKQEQDVLIKEIGETT